MVENLTSLESMIVSIEFLVRPPPQSIRKSLISQHQGSYKAIMKIAIADQCHLKCPLSTETCLYICQSSSVQPPETIFRSLMTMSAAAGATCTMARKGLIAMTAGVWLVICRQESGPYYMSKQVCDATRAYLKTRREQNQWAFSQILIERTSIRQTIKILISTQT